jgi:hypothetical protein
MRLNRRRPRPVVLLPVIRTGRRNWLVGCGAGVGIGHGIILQSWRRWNEPRGRSP